MEHYRSRQDMESMEEDHNREYDWIDNDENHPDRSFDDHKPMEINISISENL